MLRNLLRVSTAYAKRLVSYFENSKDAAVKAMDFVPLMPLGYFDSLEFLLVHMKLTHFASVERRLLVLYRKEWRSADQLVKHFVQPLPVVRLMLMLKD